MGEDFREHVAKNFDFEPITDELDAIQVRWFDLHACSGLYPGIVLPES
jgi:hypothetical protein